MRLFRLRLPYQTNVEACEALLVLIRKNEEKTAGAAFRWAERLLVARSRVTQDPHLQLESETKSN